MTMRQTLQACARRWPVLLLGLLLTAGAIGLFGAGHEIYRVRTEAVLNEPLEAAAVGGDQSSGVTLEIC